MMKLNETTFKHIQKADKNDRLEVIIGDDKQPDFKPQIKIQRWDNEVNYSVRLVDDENISSITGKDKIKHIGKKRDLKFYNIKEGKELGEGGYEFEVILKERPKTNKIKFTLVDKGVEYYYQPPLTEKEKGKTKNNILNTIDDELNEVLNLFPKSVLVIGDGRGELVKILNDRGIKAVNVDNSQWAYDNKVTNNFIFADILNGLPLDDNSFDLVVSYSFLEWYVPKNKIEFVLKEIERVGQRGLFGIGFPRNKDYLNGPEITQENTSVNFWQDEVKNRIPSFPVIIKQIIFPIANRPENVIGSYAVYTKEKKINWKGGKLYRTGKVGHIYRPKIIDKNGKWVWGELNIKDSILTITIPNKFLNEATYPVIVDPTFGYDTVGGTSNGGGGIRGSVYAGVVGSGDSISAYISAEDYAGGSPSRKWGLYKSSDSSFVGGTEEVQNTHSASWETLDFTSSPTLEAIDYVIVMWNNYIYGKSGSTEITRYYDSGGTEKFSDTEYGDTWPDPASFETYSNKYSIYCTYTASSNPTITGISTITGINTITF